MPKTTTTPRSEQKLVVCDDCGWPVAEYTEACPKCGKHDNGGNQ